MKKFFSNREEIEKKLKYSFHNPEYLQLAFTHRSYWNEHQENVPGHSERLEFLGDAVLELVIAEHLYELLPDAPEGELSAIRASLVETHSCAAFAEHLGITEYLMLGKGETLNRGRGRDSILADFFESVVGAIFLDSGFDTAKKFILSHFANDVKWRISAPVHNWKAELQDFAQKKFQEAPLYEVVEEFGLEHEKQFRVVVSIKNKKVGEGVGGSKKEAQTAAAKAALENKEL